VADCATQISAGVAETGTSLRETGVAAATGCSRYVEVFQLRDDYDFAPDIPASAT